MITLCTLYDSHYLNRGLALYESIERYTQDYIMYVLAMDDKCYSVLLQLQLPRIIVVRLEEFETKELRAVKKQRSVGEYCWTCKAPLIKYTLADSGQTYCAYLDSDLYFYGDPHLFIQEMGKKQASVLLFGHRYNLATAKANERKIGKFCAGTLVFKNDANGTYMLNSWESQCLECCKLTDDGIHFGDQKYLDQWQSGSPYVVESTNMGAGVASWNLAHYKLLGSDKFGPVKIKYKGKVVQPLFYHFHALTYTAPRRVKAHAMIAWGVSKPLLDAFYIPYLRHIDRINNLLYLKFGIYKDINKSINRNVPQKTQDKRKRLLNKLSMFFSISGIKFLLFEDLPTKLYWKQDEVEF